MSDASDSGNEVGSDTCTGSAATCSNEAAAPAFEDTESDAEKDVRRKWHTHKLRGAKSKVWNWFKVYTFERCSHLAICNTCGMEVNRGPKKSTTPLQQHLDAHHPQLNVQSAVDEMEREGGMHKFAVLNPDFPDALLKWMVMTQQALSTTSSPYFKNMVKALSKNTKVPGRKALTKRLAQIDLQVRQAICKLVVGMFVSCTTDAWTSAANEAFCSLTLHWLTEAFELVSLSLDCSTFPGSHTGEAVAAKLNEMLKSYGIAEDHVVAAVTDTAPAMVKAGRFMCYDWLGCMAHLLELVTGLAFNGQGVKEALKAARSLVGSIKSSSQAAADLSTLLVSLGQPDLTVIQDVVTRWWSTYSMVARLLQLKPALELLYSTRKVKQKLAAAEWTVLEHVHLLLKPFMSVQKALEGEQYVTISLVPFLLAQLRAKLAAVSPFSPVAAVSAVMLTQFNQRFGDGTVESLPVKMAIAAALDPRTKELQGIATAEHAVVWAEVKKMVEDAHPEPKASEDDADAGTTAAAPAAAGATAAAPAAAAVEDDDDLSGDMFAGLMQQPTAGASTPVVPQHKERLLRQFNLEMTYFTDLPVLLHRDANKRPNDPLKWWREHCKHMPLLSEVARKVLCIPATSASSERLFSTAGLTVTDKRSRLTGANVGRLVFLRGSWEKAAELSNATAEASAKATAGSGSSGFGSGSSSSSAIVLEAGVVAFHNSITVASVSAAEQDAALRAAAAALPEGSTATEWQSGASGRGVGVPKAAAKGKAKQASKAKAAGVVGKKAALQKKASKITTSSKLSRFSQSTSSQAASSAITVVSSSNRTRATSDFFNPKRRKTVDSNSDEDDEDEDDSDESGSGSGSGRGDNSGSDSDADMLSAQDKDSCEPAAAVAAVLDRTT